MSKKNTLSKKDCKIKAADFDTMPPVRRKLTLNERREKGARIKRESHTGNADYQRRKGDLVNAAGKRVPKTTPMIVRHADQRVKANFKQWATTNGTNMNAAILDFMRWCGNTVTEKKIGRSETFYGRQMDGNGNFRAAFTPKIPVKFMREATAK